MNAEEITKLCLSGSKAYYDYLKNKDNGGVDEVMVSSKKKINDDTFLLKIEKKLFNPDTIWFRCDDKDFTLEDIQIKIYDNKKKSIVVKINKPKIIELIENTEADQWKVIIDLKFLVQRVIDWYNINGDSLRFCQGRNHSNLFFDDSVFIEGDSKPSNEQLEALKTIFTNKLSYIWGAPGTGKTRFVLSYALLNYLNNNRKTLILAPTNIALEQIFRGIIEVTDKAGIGRSLLLRMGYPSKKFAADFGEVCEIQGIEKQLKAIDKEIEILRWILKIESPEEIERKEKIRKLEEINTLLKIEEKLENEIDSFYEDLEYKNEKIKLCNNHLRDIAEEKTIIFKKKNSILSKIFSVFSSKMNFEEELEKLRNKEQYLKNEIVKHEEEIKEIKEKIKWTKIDKDAMYFDWKRFHERNDMSFLDIKLSELMANTNLLENMILKLKNEPVEKNAENFKALSYDYEEYSERELKDMLDELETEKSKLASFSLAVRIENSKIIGATIDTFLYRFMEESLDVAHIFIDEAGYASIVKVLTAFRSDVPITMLGDHKQLPPVCEINRTDIEKNSSYKDVFVWDQSAIYIENMWHSKSREVALRNYLYFKKPLYQDLRKSSLTQTFRFGNNLAKTLDKFVYKEDGFSSCLNRNTEVIVIKVTNPKENRNTYRRRLNIAEADAIEAYISKYLHKEDDFAVLAPYNNQIRYLKDILCEIREDEKIFTVHKSQGREWDIVLYSVCDIGNGKSPWFTDSNLEKSNGLNNINTAVSRAKKQLVIFCSYNQWIRKKNQLICGLIESATMLIDEDDLWN